MLLVLRPKEYPTVVSTGFLPTSNNYSKNIWYITQTYCLTDKKTASGLNV